MLSLFSVVSALLCAQVNGRADTSRSLLRQVNDLDRRPLRKGSAQVENHPPRTLPASEFTPSEVQDISHLKEFYEVFVKRFKELHHHELYGDNVKISFIFLDWDNTTFTDGHDYAKNREFTLRRELDEASSKMLKTLMMERIVTRDKLPNTLVMTFPVIVTCNNQFYTHMNSIVGRGETFDLVMGAERETLQLFYMDLEFDGSSYYYQLSVWDKGSPSSWLNKSVPEQSKKNKIYTLLKYPTLEKLTDALIEDGILPKADKDRIRAYAARNDDGAREGWVYKNRKLNEWDFHNIKGTLRSPKKIRFVLRPEVKYNYSINAQSLESEIRLDQIPFVFLDWDIWYKEVGLDESGKDVIKNPKVVERFSRKDNNYTQEDMVNLYKDGQALKFKKYMYRECLNGLAEEIKKRTNILPGPDMFWDFISVGDNPRDHVAMKSILGRSEKHMIFGHGIMPFQDQTHVIRDEDRKAKKSGISRNYQFSDIGPEAERFQRTDIHGNLIRLPVLENNDLTGLLRQLEEDGLRHITEVHDSINNGSHNLPYNLPSIKSYYNDMKTAIDSRGGRVEANLDFIAHLEKMEQDLGGHFMDYDGSVMLKRRQIKSLTSSTNMMKKSSGQDVN